MEVVIIKAKKDAYGCKDITQVGIRGSETTSCPNKPLPRTLKHDGCEPKVLLVLLRGRITHSKHYPPVGHSRERSMYEMVQK